VVFNDQTNKLEIKDMENDRNNNNKANLNLAGLQNLAATKMGLNGKAQNSHKMLNKKRTKNVMRDTYDESDEEKDRKINKSRNEKTSKKVKNTHIVKFTGDEYKNKSGKGDNLLQGKYEPFAYIQLNPKAISKKKKKDNIEIFEKIMQKK
jgi:ribosomal RNA-processing protein 12